MVPYCILISADNYKVTEFFVIRLLNGVLVGGLQLSLDILTIALKSAVKRIGRSYTKCLPELITVSPFIVLLASVSEL